MDAAVSLPAEAVQVLFVALYSDGRFVDGLSRAIRHLNLSSTPERPVHFHALVNKAEARLSPWCKQHELSAMPEDAQTQHSHLSHGKPRGAHIFLWKPFLFRLIPLSKVIVLDLDVVLVAGSRLHALWSEFASFGSDGVLGLVREQAPTYAAYGSHAGFNGGVQLHHLERMRNTADKSNASYAGVLRRCASGGCPGWDRIEPSLGDQTLYTHLCALQPHMCETLPCGWNRQMSTHLYSYSKYVTEWHACKARSCHLLHFNQPLLEGLVPMLRGDGSALPNCTACRSALRTLENKTRSSKTRNPKFTWGPSKEYMASQVDACCCGASGMSSL